MRLFSVIIQILFSLGSCDMHCFVIFCAMFCFDIVWVAVFIFHTTNHNKCEWVVADLLLSFITVFRLTHNYTNHSVCIKYLNY